MELVLLRALVVLKLVLVINYQIICAIYLLRLMLLLLSLLLLFWLRWQKVSLKQLSIVPGELKRIQTASILLVSLSLRTRVDLFAGERGRLALLLLTSAAQLGHQTRVFEGSRAGSVRHDSVVVVGEAAGHVRVGQEGLARLVDHLVQVLELACMLAGDRLVHKGAGERQLVEHRLVATGVRPVAPLNLSVRCDLPLAQVEQFAIIVNVPKVAVAFALEARLWHKTQNVLDPVWQAHGSVRWFCN